MSIKAILTEKYQVVKVSPGGLLGARLAAEGTADSHGRGRKPVQHCLDLSEAPPGLLNAPSGTVCLIPYTPHPLTCLIPLACFTPCIPCPLAHLTSLHTLLLAHFTPLHALPPCMPHHLTCLASLHASPTCMPCPHACLAHSMPHPLYALHPCTPHPLACSDGWGHGWLWKGHKAVQGPF